MISHLAISMTVLREVGVEYRCRHAGLVYISSQGAVQADLRLIMCRRRTRGAPARNMHSFPLGWLAACMDDARFEP